MIKIKLIILNVVLLFVSLIITLCFRKAEVEHHDFTEQSNLDEIEVRVKEKITLSNVFPFIVFEYCMGNNQTSNICSKLEGIFKIEDYSLIRDVKEVSFIYLRFKILPIGILNVISWYLLLVLSIILSKKIYIPFNDVIDSD